MGSGRKLAGRAGLLALLLSAACSPVAESAAGAQAAKPGGPALFVSNKRDASVSRIDLASGAETGRVTTCANPHELAASPDGRHVAVGCYSGNGIEILASDTLEVVKRIELAQGARPHGLLWHASGAIVAGGEGRGSIFIVRDPLAASPSVKEISAGPGAGPHMVVADAGLTTVWGTIIPTGTVVRFDLGEGRATHRKVLGGQTEALALSGAGDAVWVGSNQDNVAYRLDPATLEVEATVPTGPVPIRLLAHPANGEIAVSEFGTGGVSVIDGASSRVVRQIPVSGSEAAVQVTLLFSPDGSKLYAAETGRNEVAEIDYATGKVLRRLAAGPGGDGLAIVE